jgi:hypothetical protein
MSIYMNHGATTSEKRNSGRKSTVTEKDRHILTKIVSKDHRNTGERAAELSIHLEDLVSTKTLLCEIHKCNIHVRTAID